jgi:hypothetical protein
LPGTPENVHQDEPTKALSLRDQPENSTFPAQFSNEKSAPGRKPRKFNWWVRRRREIERYARDIGAAETDDLSRWLIAWIWHNAGSKDLPGAVMECARRLGRKGFTQAEAEDVIRESWATPRAMKADDLAHYLKLDYETRQALRITTIGAWGADKRERLRRRKERQRQADERRRRQRGARPRAEYEAKSRSQTKPWEGQGISRAQWYRQEKVKNPQIIDAKRLSKDQNQRMG